jgi:hypothetical protein
MRRRKNPIGGAAVIRFPDGQWYYTSSADIHTNLYQLTYKIRSGQHSCQRLVDTWLKNLTYETEVLITWEQVTKEILIDHRRKYLKRHRKGCLNGRRSFKHLQARAPQGEPVVSKPKRVRRPSRPDVDLGKEILDLFYELE